MSIFILRGFIISFLFLVCITVLERFSNSLDSDVKKNPKLIEQEFKNFCKTSKSKENRFVSKIFSAFQHI